MTTTTVPSWCRPGAPAVVTVGADDHADSNGDEMWRAVRVTTVDNGTITAEAYWPYGGRHTFQARGDTRPYDPQLGRYLASPDAADVVEQRRRRDEAKHGRDGVSQWALTDEGWQVKP